MSQYIRRTWDLHSGFPGGPVSAITQSSDGYLWIGTEKGPVRFDGMAFSFPRDTSHAALSLEHVLGLLPDPAGGLWIRLPEPSLVRYRDGTFAPQRPNPNHDPLVSTMALGPDASTLFASRQDGLFAWRRDHFETILAKNLLPGRALVSIAASKNGDVWLGTRDAGLLRVHGGRTETITNELANCLLVTANQELFVGTNQGLTRWDGSQMTTAGIPVALAGISILALTEDHDSNVWIGTEKGLLRLNAHGLSVGSEKKITVIFEDREGDLWAGSTDGIERLQDSPVMTYHGQNQKEWEHGGPIHVDSKGRVWTAPADGGLYSLEDGALKEVLRGAVGRDEVYSVAGDLESLWLGSKTRGLIHIAGAVRAYTQADGLPQNSIYAVHQNKDGSIWCGTLAAGVSHFQDGRFTNYSTAQGLASDTILSITEDAGGTMWFGTPLGLSSFAKEHWRTYGVRDGLPSENIITLFEDDSRVLWIGTLHGLALLRSGRVFIPAGLPAPLLGQIFGITQDRFGSLWVTTPEALIRVNRAKLLSGTLASGDFREFGISDGINDTAGIRREHSIATSSDGRIWLSRNHGVSELDPARLQRTAVRSIVHIERVVVDGEPQVLSGSLALPWNTKRIVFTYAGLNLSAPDSVRFRFKLDNFEGDWSAPVSTREADYTNLSPGAYRFHVMASNADLVWNDVGAELPFRVNPALWQTWWFRTAALLLLILTAGIVYSLRMRQITENANVRFEAQLAERTRIARELHDTLLQSFHGLILRFQAAQNLLPEKPVQAQQSLAISIERAAKAITEGRDAVQALRGSDACGDDFVAAVTAMGHQLTGSAQFRVLLEGKPRQLIPELQEDCYRILREAVANAVRHANAGHIELEIRYDPRMLRLRVRDDGIGMDPAAATGRQGHWGLTGMQERAKASHAQLEIWSELKQGTEIELTVPASIAYLKVSRSIWGRFRK